MGRLKETQKYLDGWGKKHGPVVGRGSSPYANLMVEKLSIDLSMNALPWNPCLSNLQPSKRWCQGTNQRTIGQP
jgi:hypothetical protein